MGLDQQDLIATGIAASYDRPIVVSVMSKLDKFPFLQLLAYNAQLGYTVKDFLGLKDFYDEMTIYSGTNVDVLQPAWNSIKTIAPVNPDVQALTYTDPILGQVGLPFLTMVGFAETFAVAPDELLTASASSIVASNS